MVHAVEEFESCPQASIGCCHVDAANGDDDDAMDYRNEAVDDYNLDDVVHGDDGNGVDIDVGCVETMAPPNLSNRNPQIEWLSRNQRKTKYIQ